MVIVSYDVGTSLGTSSPQDVNAPRIELSAKIYVEAFFFFML